MDHQRRQRLKPLLDKLPPGFLADTRWLKAQGIDAKSIHDYVARGWLERLIRGVYRRPLPAGVPSQPGVPWESVVLSLQWIMAHPVHVGGVTALNLAGYAHYLPLGGTAHIHLYGHVPSWLTRLPINAQVIVHRRTLFGSDEIGIIDTAGDASSTAVNIARWPLRVASPERAVLEALDELDTQAGFSALDQVFQSLTTLRPNQLMRLLVACRSIKVRRLFFVFADRHRHAWRKHLDARQIDLGSGPRALVKGGKLHPGYRIYVPAGFLPGHDEEAGTDA